MKFSFLIPALACASLVHADNLKVTEFDYYGPFPVVTPFMVDSLDVNSGGFSVASALKQPLEKKASRPSGKRVTGPVAPGHSAPAVHLLAFSVENSEFAKPEINITGVKDYVLTVDGEKADKKLTLSPATHRFVIKYLSSPESTDSIGVSFSDAGKLRLRTDGNRVFDIHDVLEGPRPAAVSISPDGKYLITRITTTDNNGKTSSFWKVTETASGKTVGTSNQNIQWMPSSNLYYITRPSARGLDIVAFSPLGGNEKIVAENIPQGRFIITPDEKSLLYILTDKGPREDSEVYQILEPEDRQPGWRDRNRLALYDIADGTFRQLTHGFRNIQLLDVADDSSHVLFSVAKTRYEKRPTTLFDILSLDVRSMKADTVALADGFIGAARYASPSGEEVVVSGSPESFGGIGKNLPEGRIPSMTDTQLFLWKKNKGITPLTRDFDPKVKSFEWNRFDNQIYLIAENRDYLSLYRLDPATGKITMVNQPEDAVKNFTLASSAPAAAFYGQSVSNPDRVYFLDTRKHKLTLLDEPVKEMLSDVRLGKCEAWDFVNSRGDTIYGRFYLPPDFDPDKKYPLIVNYYGGCNPTSRAFEGRYPHNAYASQGYVVYVIEPSGATGFGQEFSSRHVNTAGEGVAQDIIEGTQRFCETHPYVDPSKIGCIGASYGGFMTQYLQTLTPMFAAAISHAGISDHTSYWGEGYWGYSYSEVAMAESYPWNQTDLFVKHSPLYNADKINTPILFLHGDADMNVPLGESIQMFTALKLLGKDTAFVAVADQEHHILDYHKRLKWQDTIFAWFAKYLKDDPTWWNHLYPEKNL